MRQGLRADHDDGLDSWYLAQNEQFNPNVVQDAAAAEAPAYAQVDDMRLGRSAHKSFKGLEVEYN